MITRNALSSAVTAAERFLYLAGIVSAHGDLSQAGAADRGALTRASMDLTRELARMRRSGRSPRETAMLEKIFGNSGGRSTSTPTTEER